DDVGGAPRLELRDRIVLAEEGGGVELELGVRLGEGPDHVGEERLRLGEQGDRARGAGLLRAGSTRQREGQQDRGETAGKRARVHIDPGRIATRGRPRPARITGCGGVAWPAGSGWLAVVS